MTKVEELNIVVSLDIGTSKVVAVIGDVLPDGVINVLGAGICPSKGVDRGGVIDLDAVVRSIQYAIEEAESISNLDFMALTLSISGPHITGLNEVGQVPLGDVVSQDDIDAAMHYARSVRLPDGLEILHTVQQEFKVDRLPVTKNPLGLSGNRLVAHTHLIAAHQDWKRNLINAVEHVERDKKFKIADIVFSGLASSYSVLTEDEKELGVCLIDIGAGTMDVMIYTDGALRFSKVFPYGGNDITDYLAQTFATSRKDAENIKINYGSAVSPPHSNPDKKFSIAGLAGGAPRIYTKSHVATITSQCYTDLFGVVASELAQLRKELFQNGIKQELIAGFVLTGGGSQIEDIVECAKNVFGAHVRVGSPLHIMGLTDYVNKPQYATALGLLQYSHHNPKRKENIINNPKVGDFIEICTSKSRKAINWIKSRF